MEKEKVVNIQPLMDSQVESQFTQQIQEDFNKKNPDHSALLHSLETVEVLDVLSDYYTAHEKTKNNHQRKLLLLVKVTANIKKLNKPYVILRKTFIVRLL
ncbi:AraC family transcriptional regulator [Listeria monocytogenes FSL F6-684]|nr:AraC family transcriptional regulator [Listeria monocytogenes FSL F6-684]